MDVFPTAKTILEKMPALVSRFRMAQHMRKSQDKVRVLIVEDQLFSRKLLQEVLRPAFVVDSAETAKEGIHLFFENAPELVFLDIELADSSGHMIAKLVKEFAPETFVVMVTGNNSAEDVALARAHKVDGFIVKPYSKGKIYECTEKFLTLHPERRLQGDKP